MTHYFFLPPVSRPMGGVNVLIQMIAVLRAAGYPAAPLYGTAEYAYPYGPALDEPHCFDPRLRGIGLLRGVRGMARRIKQPLSKRSTGRNQQVRAGAGDVVVVPEFVYPEVVAALPDCAHVLAVQAVTGLANAHGRDRQDALRQLTATVVTSQACAEIAAALGQSDLLPVTLEVGHPGLEFTAQKKRQVAYVPNKLPDDAKFCVEVLRRSPELAGFDFVPIIGMSREDVARTMCESLFFLNFTKREGFGLPAAEAMKAGAIVVGYPAIGSSEFFTEATGFPVANGDVAGLIRTTRAAAAEYSEAPARLDAMRRDASDLVSDRYAPGTFAEDVRRAWGTIAARVGPTGADDLADPGCTSRQVV